MFACVTIAGLPTFFNSRYRKVSFLFLFLSFFLLLERIHYIYSNRSTRKLAFAELDKAPNVWTSDLQVLTWHITRVLAKANPTKPSPD